MEYFDKELLEIKERLKRKEFDSLETGMYAGDEKINFIKIMVPDTNIALWLPKSFVPMPESIKKIKYPSVNAPEWIVTSLDTLVNIGFSLLPVVIEDNDIKSMSEQFQRAITNVNPSIKIKNRKEEKTKQGNAMSWFDFVSYAIDGQSYNRFCLIRMRKNVFHGIFNCEMRNKGNWEKIVEKIFMAVEEVL